MMITKKKKKENIYPAPNSFHDPQSQDAALPFQLMLFCFQHSLDPYVSMLASANLLLMSKNVSVVPSSTLPLSDLKSHGVDAKI